MSLKQHYSNINILNKNITIILEIQPKSEKWCVSVLEEHSKD